MPSTVLRLFPFAIALAGVWSDSTCWSAVRTDRTLREQVTEDLADNRLDEFSLFAAALIVGGVDEPSQLETLVASFTATCEREAVAMDACRDGRERLDVLLAFMHRHYLTGEYRAEISELHRTIIEGHFNCVTSTILFRSLCDRFGIPARAVASRSHLMCWLPLESGIYVETTCRDWRVTDTGQGRQFLAKIVGTAEWREISDAQLVGKVFYNQGVAALETAQFAPAVSYFRSAWQLDRADSAARENLTAALNNWALAECDATHYASAVERISQGLSLDPQYAPLRANDVHIHQQWIKQLCAGGEYRQAIDVLNVAHRRRPDVELFDQGRAVVYRQWAQSQFATGAFEDGWRKLGLAGKLSANRHERGVDELALVATTYRQLIQAGYVAQADRLLAQAMQRFPGSSKWLRQLESGNLPGGEL